MGPAQLILLLVAVAVISAAAGFAASSLARRNKRRSRGYFVAGFVCGWAIRAVPRRRRRLVRSVSRQYLSRLGALASR
jgi:hypothetical protein